MLIERTWRPPQAEIRDGLPLAPRARAILDACRRLTDVDSCRALMTEAVQRRLTTTGDLGAELELATSRESPLPRRVLRELAPGTESVAEIDAHRVWRLSGLPPAAWNGLLRDASGAVIASPDAWWNDVGVAWEIDSVTFHADQRGFASTLARNARYSAAGVTVLQTLPRRLRSDAATVAEELKAAYAAAAARPRPSVRFEPRER